MYVVLLLCFCCWLPIRIIIMTRIFVSVYFFKRFQLENSDSVVSDEDAVVGGGGGVLGAGRALM